MVDAVVFAFAVADGLKPVVGAAPYDVLGRQLPRLLVVRLNGGGDRGVRYFPFLGMVGGHRAFLAMHQRFESKQLVELHKQGEVRLLCDGQLEAGMMQWRALDGGTGKVLREIELPFDPRQPTAVLARLEFEVMDLLGVTGAPHADFALQGEALGWWLIVKDALLGCEAGLGDGRDDPLRGARRLIELAPGSPEAAELILDLAAHQLQNGGDTVAIRQMLGDLASSPGLPAAYFERLAALLLTSGDEAAAATLSARAAKVSIDNSSLVERSVGLLFRQGRCREALELVDLARAHGVASVTALAQGAACCDRLGDREHRSQLCEELMQRHDRSAAVSRVLVSFLLEEERADAARLVAQQALDQDPAQPVLHFELGRACLLLDDCERAVVALRAALEHGLPTELESRAQRLLRLASVPGLWRQSVDVEALIANGDAAGALQRIAALAWQSRRTAEVWYLVGLVRHKLGDDHRAERALQRALRLDDGLSDAHNRLGILLVARGEPAAGLPHLERAHEMAPDEPSPMLHLAQALACLGRFDEAQKFIDGATAVGGDPAMIDAVRREVLSARQ